MLGESQLWVAPNPSGLNAHATIESLDLKSIDIVMILTAIEDKFDVYIPMDGPFHDAKNVKDLIDAIASYIIKEKQ